jgi:hypothetical protein
MLCLPGEELRGVQRAALRDALRAAAAKGIAAGAAAVTENGVAYEGGGGTVRKANYA